jgi:hypothetical protein
MLPRIPAARARAPTRWRPRRSSSPRRRPATTGSGEPSRARAMRSASRTPDKSELYVEPRRTLTSTRDRGGPPHPDHSAMLRVFLLSALALALAAAEETTVLTGSTFEPTVYESGKSVFVRAPPAASRDPAADPALIGLALPRARAHARCRRGGDAQVKFYAPWCVASCGASAHRTAAACARAANCAQKAESGPPPRFARPSLARTRAGAATARR